MSNITTATLKIPVTAEDHIQGQIDAPILLVEYGDYECPHCGRAHPIVKRVQKHFGPHQLGFVFRNFPLTKIHANAQAAAETAEFAGTHDQFWPMHDAIFENQESLDLPFLLDLVQTLGLPAEALRTALANGEFAPRVKADFLGGVRSGVNGTPTFFINGHRHDAPFEFETLVAAIEARLAGE